MENMYHSATDLIGNTPLLFLHRYMKKSGISDVNVIAKLEYFNPTGSVKDRVALSMIEDAEEKGLLKPGATIIEPTSGNTGIGIASVAAIKGYKAILTLPETMTIERRNILKAYGAEIVLTDGFKGMKGAIEKAEELHEQIPGSVILAQFDNMANPKAHIKTTGPEIWKQTEGKVDIFVSGLGSGGTLQGITEFLKEKNPNLIAAAVEPKNVSALLGDEPGLHQIQGIGDGFIPSVLDTSLIDEVVTVTDDDAIGTTRMLARKQGLMCGTSSGANIWACMQMAEKYGKDKIIATVLPDRMERYFSTGLL